MESVCDVKVKVEIILDERSGRLKARTVCAERLARDAAEDCQKKRRPVMWCRFGGSVCNSYGYPAETECALAVAIPTYGEDGSDEIVVAVYCNQVPANKVTRGGCAESCLPGSRPIWDSRFNADSKLLAKDHVINQAIKDLAQYAGLSLAHIKPWSFQVSQS